MKILVINAGSSSLKYQLIDMDNEQMVCKGNCERIGMPGGIFTHKTADGRELKKNVNMLDHAAAFMQVKNALIDGEYGVINSLDEVAAVGHRIVQGGSIFHESVLVDEKVIEDIESLIPLAPLHNKAHSQGIRACREVFGEQVPEVVVFDTAFHATMPPKAYMFNVPYEYYEKYAVRRYGFHGTSHRYVTLRAAELLGKDPKDLKIVSCHLGNGSSLAAVDGGKCVDTSMGLTPLAGLPMGTRAGDMDVGVIEYVANKYDRSISSVMEGLNKRSGMMGLSGVSSDFRDLEAAAAKGHHRSAIALRIFEYRVHKMIAEYAAAMNGVDVVVFTAGVGENAPSTRAHILEGLDFMGITCDEEKNNTRGEERIISKDGAPVTVMVIPTNEELMIAQDTLSIVEENKNK